MAEPALKKDVQQQTERRKFWKDLAATVGQAALLGFISGVTSAWGKRLLLSASNSRSRRDGNVIPMNRASN